MHKKQHNLIRDSGLSKALHKTNPEYFKYEYEDMLSVFAETVVDLLLEGTEVQLENFGTFKIQHVRQHTKPHLKTREPVLYPASVNLKFTPSRTMNKRLKEMYNEKTKS